jgi:DNA-binding NarL/FixJ family response regulator
MSLVGPVIRARDVVAKTLLVSSESGGPVASCLADAGCLFTRVPDGTVALRRVHHERFDQVIVVSTGKEMDLVETVLNLRDIRPSTPVIILSDPTNPECNPALEAAISLAIPKLSVRTLEEFQRELEEIQKR